MRERKLKSEINVVPYIDVMLVLLVIFMVTAPLINTGVVDLPSVGKSNVVDADNRPLQVNVSAGDGLSVKGLQGHGEGLRHLSSMRELKKLISEELKKSPQRPVLVAGDKDAIYERVLQVMDELQQVPVRRVGLLVNRR